MALWLSGLAVTGLADDSEQADLPSAALLEFLADWEDATGEWQDPMEYADPQWQLPEPGAEQNDE